MKIIDTINLSEARQSADLIHIADMIYEHRDKIKIVLIAGPSGSGKTSTSKRLALQCRVLGLNPKVIELDDYFVEREQTPLDENGEYDFECLEAMDLKLLGEQLNALLAGEEVSVPDFDFVVGTKVYGRNIMKLHQNDILILEGIHALNPAMLPSVDVSKLFKIYISPKSSDIRLLRRMIRDNRTRGKSPEDTIAMWPKVCRGGDRYITPYKDNADVAFNSELDYEMAALKYYAEPLLRHISPSSPAFPEASRLLKSLSYIVALSPAEMAAVPPTSILREFIDGQTL